MPCPGSAGSRSGSLPLPQRSASHPSAPSDKRHLPVPQCNSEFDFNNDVIYIYSDKTQIYKVLYQEENPYDSSGQQVKFRVLDQDGDYGHIRLRIENNGNSQIYVDFNNVSWVYNVKRTR